MAYLTERKYSFVSTGLDGDTFAVVEFSGVEGLSQCYRFEILLVTDNAEIDLGSVLQNPARFSIHRDERDDVDFHGILSNFEQLHEVDEHIFYRATLVPKLWWLSLTHHNQVFLDKTVIEMVEEVLKDGGLTTLDFEFRLQGETQKIGYVCQYGETHLNFISRWLEREGIYYYFEQTESGEKIIITDTAISHTDSAHGGSLRYAPPSGLGDAHRREIIQSLICRYNTLPRTIRLKDYNYREPSLEMAGSAMVDERGRGEVYYYGEHFRTPEEGNLLAGIRAQELLCRKEEFIGDSTVPYVQTGYTFTLQDHYRESFNIKYLTAQMTHEGSQTGYLISGIMKGLSDREERVYYQNHFTAIPASVQFRPQRTAEKPKISGTIHGKIDAAGSGQYAELDDEGRYKVILPFDRSGRKGGKASTWLRMLQPYAGSNHGMHFPLHKGTEVLLSFIDGDPDRPIIAGAVPNPETPSPVTAADQTMSKITTSGGNKIHIEDKEGSQRILLQAPTAGTYVRMGAPNDPTASDKQTHKELHEEEEGYKIETGGAYILKAGAGKLEIVGPLEQKLVTGNSFESIGGAEEHVNMGVRLDLSIIADMDFKLALGVEFSNWIYKIFEENITVNAEDQELTIGMGKADIRGGSIDVTGDDAEVIGSNTNLTGDNVSVHGDETVLWGRADRVTGDDTQVTGNVTTVAGDDTRIEGSVETLTGDHTVVTGDDSVIQADTVTISGRVNAISADRCRLGAAIVGLQDIRIDT